MTKFYDSAVFWTEACVAAAIVAIIITVLLWYIGTPRRLLIYSLFSDTALLASRVRELTGSDLTVSLHTEILSDPHVVSVRVESRSRRDIRGTDFESDKPLVIDVGTPILKILDCETGGTAMPAVCVGTSGSALNIGPALIKRHQVIAVNLLTDAKPQLTCPNPPLADVTIKQRRIEDFHPAIWKIMATPLLLAQLICIGLIGLIALIEGLFLHYSPRPGPNFLAGIVSSFITIFSISGIIIFIRRSTWR
jgi:hypothetical protein